MRDFFNYKIDKKKDSYSATIQLKNFIENFVSQDQFRILFEKFKIITAIPDEVLINKSKKIIYSNFDFNRGKFNKKFNILMIFRDVLFYIWIIFCSVFLSKKKPDNIKSYQVILDDVDQESAFAKFKKLLSMTDSSLVILSEEININKLKNANFMYFNKRKLVFDKDYLLGKKIMFIKFFFFLLFYSLKYRLNLFSIFNIILFQTLKYETIFSSNKGKYLLIERFWRTCSIKNYIFKKHGGVSSSCLQKNILEASISLFIDTDVIFTLGSNKNNNKTISDLGGKLTSDIPVGSISMENKWFLSERDTSKIPNIDLLCLGHNPSTFIEVNDAVKKNYFEHIKWLKNLS